MTAKTPKVIRPICASDEYAITPRTSGARNANKEPYTSPTAWRRWLKDERRRLPEPWPPPGERRLASDGCEYALRSRALAFDPLDQSTTLAIRAEQWREGEQLAEEEHQLTIRFYFRNELLLLLERAGFLDVVVRADYTDEEPTGDSDFLVFIAKKPRGAR